MTLVQLALLSLTATALFACAGSSLPAGPITSYTLPGQAVYPEGITYNDTTKSFYVSSFSDGTIFRGEPGKPTAEVFLPPNPTERPTAVGLNTDNTGKLFIAGGPSGKMFVYDLNTKALLRAYMTPATAQGGTFINDVAIAGEYAYFTDSLRPTIFRIPRTATTGNEAEAWLDVSASIPYGTAPGQFNLNGITVTPDGQYLLTVQMYNGKLFRIGLADNSVVEIRTDGPLVNGDGLYLDGHTLYVLRNAEQAVVPVRLNADYTVGTMGTPFTDPSFRFPTTLTKANGRLLVVNSQFNVFFTPGATPELPFTVSSIAIPAP